MLCVFVFKAFKRRMAVVVCAKVTRSACRGSNDRVRDKIEHSPKLSDVSNHEF